MTLLKTENKCVVLAEKTGWLNVCLHFTVRNRNIVCYGGVNGFVMSKTVKCRNKIQFIFKLTSSP